MVTRENEPLVECTVVLRVLDPDQARRVLDEAYEPEGDGWAEHFPINDDESVLRARIDLAGDRLTVATVSEPRADRVLAALTDQLPGLQVVSDQRVPAKPGQLPRTIASLPAPVTPDEFDPAAVEEVVDLMERRWCDEEVPALGGLTPRQAAADPTRRGDVERLIASFPEIESSAPWIAMRPARLRELLDLTASRQRG